MKKPRFSGIFRFASRADIPLLSVGSILITLSAVASPMQTLIYGKVFDRLARYMTGGFESVEAFLAELRVLIGAMMAVAGGRLLFAWLGITVWLIVGENTQMNARKSLFESLLHKDIEWLGTKENLIGSLTVFFRCIEEIRSGISENLGLFVQTVASVCCLFVIAMISLWSLTLVICCLIPLSALSSWVFGNLTSKYATQENLLNARALKILDWCFMSGATVRVLNGKFADLVEFSRVVDASAVAFTHMAFAISANTAALKLMSNLVVIGGLAFGQHLVSTGQLGLGNVITAFSACVLFGTEISSVGDIVALLNKAQASSNTIDTLDFGDPLDVPPPLHLAASEVSCFSQKTPCADLQLHSLGFRYRNTDVDVLADVSMEFHSTQLNFLVGESGSGKSTVALLLAGFLEKTQGDILVDGVSYDCLDQAWFTENVCFVELHPLVFERLLAENLLLGTELDPRAPGTKTLLEEACEFADLLGFLALLPLKMNLVLLSSKLSGGQIQKIGLARAWLANRPVVVLDEALGSINSKAKLAIMDRIRAWRRGSLTIIVTHDLTDLQRHDAVWVLEKGRVKSSGRAADMRDVLPKLEMMPKTRSDSKSDDDDTGTVLDAPPSYHYMSNPAVLRDLELALDAGPVSVQRTEAMGLFAIVRFCYRTTENKFLITFGLVCALLGGVATPGLSYCFAEVLSIIVQNAVVQTSGPGAVVTWALIIVGVSVADLAVTFGSHMLLQYALEKWILKLRKRCLARINDQDMAFFGTASASYLNTLLMNDTRDLRNLVSQFLLGLLLVVSLTGLGLVWAVAIGWKLALVGVAFVPLVFLVTMTYSFLLQKYETAYKDHVADAEKFSHEVVAAMRTVRLFGLAAQLADEHQAKLQRLYAAGCRRAVSGGFGIALSELCSTSATATVLYYGMYLVVRQEYTQTQMIQVLTMLTFTVGSAAYLMKLLPEITRGQRAGTLITRLLALGELPVECGGAEKRAAKSAPVVAFDNVCFAYSDALSHTYKAVLQNTTFLVLEGEAVVVAGECGSGKSTIALMMLRLYAQDRGTIYYHGKDIRTYDPEWYRSHVALVSQAPAFFEASILENLLYGLSGSARASATAVLEDCLRAANASEFIENLPDGLATILGHETLFSLGQLQRLSIARVLLRKPKVIVFDEPTSRLDAENCAWVSSLIFSDLHKFNPQLTTIVISHDPKVMAQASRVLMVQNGHIAEDGGFHELLARGGVFAQFMK
ncbi:hypothetical protein METBIDRAFT_36552 [Metschnikowia bicuspidata var. bicuspidata NRRL YB-4993]|uniref:P-loop containing nucleoside triphosphate hydrolase protein n=1 Tax=Metschnikowia bicuspidata var. bicuspidata NRRL YB-4993 TaxID=869754 RepID=A0A1A0HI63_9ASCO|nr:hypothetical protein METBIDRAFT_36552 [Metschnikowia bicuspidata var. bicuspidata NRRL YB-4993]OBA23533.1 hypothetical protein METBIDRAFT_36552 [Metschnikowia bicuspidata var. bicuspidata NRRL YB-4993]